MDRELHKAVRAHKIATVTASILGGASVNQAVRTHGAEELLPAVHTRLWEMVDAERNRRVRRRLMAAIATVQAEMRR